MAENVHEIYDNVALLMTTTNKINYATEYKEAPKPSFVIVSQSAHLLWLSISLTRTLDCLSCVLVT